MEDEVLLHFTCHFSIVSVFILFPFLRRFRQNYLYLLPEDGYKRQAKKSAFTGSAKVVGTEKLEQSQVTNVTDALAGAVPGVTLTSNRCV